MRFPTSDLSQRLLQNGGKVPYGLFRPNAMRVRPRRGPPPEIDQIARLVAEMRTMLRDLSGLNVRTPSHIAPPFRAQQFVFQTLLTTTNVDPLPVFTVPVGSNGVISQVLYSYGPLFNGANAAAAWGETGAALCELQLQLNGQAIPGFEGLLPSVAHGLQLSSGADFLLHYSLVPSITLHPITLREGDSVTFTNVISTIGNGYLQVVGYTYPIEVDGDGIRGTLADRG